MTNVAMEDFVRWCEGKLVKSRDQLEPLESGRVYFGIRPFGGRWEDITVREIRRVKANIAELEALIVQYSKLSAGSLTSCQGRADKPPGQGS